MEISTPSPDGITDCTYFPPLEARKPDEIYKLMNFQIWEKKVAQDCYPREKENK